MFSKFSCTKLPLMFLQVVMIFQDTTTLKNISITVIFFYICITFYFKVKGYFSNDLWELVTTSGICNIGSIVSDNKSGAENSRK